MNRHVRPEVQIPPRGVAPAGYAQAPHFVRYSRERPPFGPVPALAPRRHAVSLHPRTLELPAVTVAVGDGLLELTGAEHQLGQLRVNLTRKGEKCPFLPRFFGGRIVVPVPSLFSPPVYRVLHVASS